MSEDIRTIRIGLTPKQLLSRAFWFGYFSHMFLTLGIQDWYGLNVYIEKVKSGWADTSWLMWAALFCFVVYLHISQKSKVDG